MPAFLPTTIDELSPTEFAAAVAAGDHTAWAQVLARHGRMVEAKIRSFRLQEADAHDAQQTTWMQLLRHADRLHTPEHLGGWLARVAAHECLAIIRRNRRNGWTDVDAVDRLVDPEPGPEQAAIDAEIRHSLHDAVDGLGLRRQTLVRALFVDELSYTALAEELDVPIGSIGPTRARALTELRHRLDDRQTA